MIHAATPTAVRLCEATLFFHEKTCSIPAGFVGFFLHNMKILSHKRLFFFFCLYNTAILYLILFLFQNEMCYAFNLIVTKNKQEICLGKTSIKRYQNNIEVLLGRLYTRGPVLQRDINDVFVSLGFDQDVTQSEIRRSSHGTSISGHTRYYAFGLECLNQCARHLIKRSSP